LESRVAIGRSRFLVVLLLIWAVLASIAVVVSSLPTPGTYCLFSLILWSVVRGVYCHALRYSDRSVMALTFGSGGADCSIQFRDGWTIACRFAEGSVIWPGLLMLKLFEIERGRSFTLPLMRDAMSSVEWRRLSILMRQRATGVSS